MPRIPDQLQQAVVFLYATEEAARNGSGGGATGFFIDVPLESGKRRIRYLVTNQHVAQGRDRYARLCTRDGGIDVLKIDASTWFPHPNGDDIAVAIIPESLDHWTIFGLEHENIAATKLRMKELNIGVGDEIFMLGRFISHSGLQKNQPLARFGNIAMMPGEGVKDGRGLEVEAFLIEMRSLSGFSGSPVFVYVGPASYRGNGTMMPFYTEQIGLIGIDTGHKTVSTPVRDSETNNMIGQVAVNTGVSIVAPIWKINEALQAASAA
ncbi:MAG TPA: hypothetical protein VF601_10215 [Beijerinckiaceae bacterium]|jgi:hypothetical protein